MGIFGLVDHESLIYSNMMVKSLALRKTAVLVIACLSVLACATVESDYMPGSVAMTTSSPRFEFSPGLRIAVLPFTVLGNPNRTIDISESEKLAMKLQSIGFTIIESLVFQKHEFRFQGLIPEQDWEVVQGVLDIDYFVFGTIDYTYNSGYSLFGKGHYYLSSASVRFVDTNTGEVVVIATTSPVPGSMAEEIGESIKNHFFRD